MITPVAVAPLPVIAVQHLVTIVHHLIVVQQQIDTAVGMEIVKTVINTDTAVIVETALVA